MHALTSELVGDTFAISILAPPEGVDGPMPVIFCTDANNYFGAAANIVTMLTLGGEIPQPWQDIASRGITPSLCHEVGRPLICFSTWADVSKALLKILI